MLVVLGGRLRNGSDRRTVAASGLRWRIGGGLPVPCTIRHRRRTITLRNRAGLFLTPTFMTPLPAPPVAPLPGGPGRPPLRLALLLDDLVQPAWIASCIEEVQGRGDARIVLVVRNAGPGSSSRPRRRWSAWWANRRYLVHALHLRVDGRASVVRDPMAPVDISARLKGVPVMDVAARETRFSDHFEPAVVRAIRDYQLDVAVRFGFRILRGDALSIAVHGVWSYHHDDGSKYRGGPAGFWEVMLDDPVTGAMLQRLSEELDGGEVLVRGWSRSVRHSVRRNRAHYYWQSAPFLAWKLRDLRHFGPDSLRADRNGAGGLVAYSRRIFTTPTNAQMVGLGYRLAARYLRRRVRAALTHEQWFLAYRQRPESVGDSVPDLVPCRFRRLIPPTDRFWADPFPYRANGTTWVFFEESIDTRPHPHIAVLEFGPGGPVGSPRIALAPGIHLSYPFVFEHDGRHYMMPESAGAGRVQLWRAEELPCTWVPDAVLIDERPLVDATMAFVDGRWWIWAAGTASGGESWDEVHLYHSDSPLGPWRPHPRNPVIVDVRCARPAGRLFQHGGTWYRPAQDCSTSYGGAMVLQRIERLDLRAYEERTVTRMDPTWDRDLVGTHTLNACGGLTVIDVRRRHWRWMR